MRKNPKRIRAYGSAFAGALPAFVVSQMAFAGQHPKTNDAKMPPTKVVLEWPICSDPSLGFGYQVDPSSKEVIFHPGIDFKSVGGLDVHASAAGEVVAVERRGSYGLLITIDHGGGVRTRYAGLEAALVKHGDRVESGQLVARVGSTGTAGEPRIRKASDLADDARPKASSLSHYPHLHYELWVFDVVRNPLEHLCPRVGCGKTRPDGTVDTHRALPHWPLALACP